LKQTAITDSGQEAMEIYDSTGSSRDRLDTSDPWWHVVAPPRQYYKYLLYLKNNLLSNLIASLFRDKAQQSSLTADSNRRFVDHDLSRETGAGRKAVGRQNPE
jgi:hypothetical protein